MTREWTEEERQKAREQLLDRWDRGSNSAGDDAQCEINEGHKLISAALADYQRYGTITHAEQDDLEVWLERNK
jgi:hypothetical protein